jgi:heme-degrading monooxygenase HmoA
MPRPLWLSYKGSWWKAARPNNRTFSDDRGDEKMIVRVWRTKLNPVRLEAYRQFERAQCLTMLRKQPGLLGSLFLRDTAGQAVSLTFWEDGGAVEALESSPSYQKMTREMVEEALLAGEPSVEVWDVQSGELRVEALLRVLEVLSRSF